MLSGYHTLPKRRLFWSTDEDCSVPFVSNAMRRNSFDDILRYLHCADNSKIVPGTDKLFKIRPLFEY